MVPYILSLSSISTGVWTPRPGRPTSNPLSPIALSLHYLFAAVLLIWAGIGSCNGRRWVRPVIIIACAWYVYSDLLFIAAQFLRLVFDLFPVSPYLTSRSSPLPQNMRSPGLIVGILIATAILVGIPAAALHFFAKSSTHEKLASLDPIPNWTDHLSLPALVWAGLCIYCGLANLLAAPTEFAILFIRIATDQWAVLQLGITSLIFFAGAALCYSRPMIGWHLTFPLVALLALSTLLYTDCGDPAQLYMLMSNKPSPSQLPLYTSPIFIGLFGYRSGGALLYCAACAYGLYARRFLAQK